MHFEENELKYAKMKSICIIPLCVLFETVKKVLEKEVTIDRQKFEDIIAKTNGIVERLYSVQIKPFSLSNNQVRAKF